MARTFMLFLGVWHLLLGIHSPVLGSAVEEEARSDHYLQAAISYTNQADGNKTELTMFQSNVTAEKNSNHPELAECLYKINEEFDKAAYWVQTAHQYHQIAQAEHLKCQAAVRAMDEEDAKNAKEEVKKASEKCFDAAKEVAAALQKANEYYYQENKAAEEPYKVYQEYREVKFLYDLAISESADLTALSGYVNEATAQTEKERQIASLIREEKERVDYYLPIAHSEMAKAERENDRAQQAAKSWDESTASSASEAAEDACEDAEEAIEEVRKACEEAKKAFHEHQREEQKLRNSQTEDAIKLREELMSSLQNIIQESVNASDQSISEETTTTDGIVGGFHNLMKDLLASIEAKLRVRMPKRPYSWYGYGAQNTSPDTTEMSLAEFMQHIFRPIPAEWHGSIYNTSTKSCVTTLQAFRNVYYNQIEILQRGLPTPLLQYQFSKPFSKVAAINDQTCIPHALVQKYFTADWYLKDTLVYGGLLEMNSIEQENGMEFPFLSFTTVKTADLPSISKKTMDKINELWKETVDQKNKLEAAISTPKEVLFPRTVELLYDPDKTDACTDYIKFGSLHGKGTLDARKATALLISSALRVIAMGGSKPSVAQMLANLSGFLFNGVRCTGTEGKDVRVPAELMKAYAANTARLIGDILILQPDPEISFSAVEEIYATEISAMTSFDTWGNYYFHAVYPDGHYDHLSVLEALYMDDKHNTVFAMSREAIGNSGSNISARVSTPSQRTDTCGQQFKYEPEIVVQTSVLESCCASTCNLMNNMEDCFDLYIICCHRCNGYSCLATTLEDMENLPDYTVIVPEYGERYPFAVPIML